MNGITILPSKEEDKKYLIDWLNDPEVLQWFPMCNMREIEDAANIWMNYIKQNAVWTAYKNGIPCGVANLYIQNFPKLSHQCLFAIIVNKEFRGQGVGTQLILELQKMAKEKFKIEMLHLEVYKGNPAKRLYDRLGFIEYGVHKNFLKNLDGTYNDKIMMYKYL
jgi:putative acetyltransferase